MPLLAPTQLVILFVAGATLIVFGLIPSLFDQLQEGISNLAASLSSLHRYRVPTVELAQHSVRLWLVAIGLGLIILGLLDFMK